MASIITDSKIKAIKSNGKEQWLGIGDGLYLRVRPNGKKFFVSRYSFNGKQKKFTLGEYPALKLAVAKKINLEVKEKILKGIDPIEEKREKQKQKEHGFSQAVIESQLAHTIGNKVTQAYMRSDFLEERKKLLEWWYKFLEE